LRTEQGAAETNDLTRAIEVFIHVSMVVILTAACFFILRPFLPIIAWGVIVAIAVYPAYRKLQHGLGGRRMFPAIVITAILLALLIVPVVLLAGTLITGLENFTRHVREGTLVIPPPPPSVQAWPIVGAPLNRAWGLASTNISSATAAFAPQIKEIFPPLLSASAGIGLTVLKFALSILVAGAILANTGAASRASHSLANRIFGERGAEFEELAGSTIRSVTSGILGVALIQATLGAIGFLLAGVPAAGLWAVLLLVAALLQVAVVVLIPAVIYMFTVSAVTKAVIFAAWCLFVALVDNVLKPLLLGRGVATPIVIVFLGAIGGFVAMGILGLFVGAIFLSVGYKLFLAWLAVPGTDGRHLSGRQLPG
jgi:predicted PurR-regulated permease PerM